ncbi:hypothetical protein GCM10007863_21790 [Dyella mobilis]|nr:hypothetical protein GCM10007863_21790 [Dyella mobilis]
MLNGTDYEVLSTNTKKIQVPAPIGADSIHRMVAYVARGEKRAAYKRAFAAQLAINAKPPA